MRICVLANADLASNYALNLLLPELARQHQLWLFISSRVGAKADKPHALKTLQFFEQDLFNQLLFPAVGDAQPPMGKFKTFAQLNPYLVAPFSELNTINDQSSVNMLQQLELDLILSVRYGRILKQPVIQLPRLGVLNLHSGLLPQYRGVMATFYAMLNGEKQIGTSLHYIQDASIDTGDLVSLNPVATNYSQCYLANVLSLYPSGCEATLNAIAQLHLGHKLSTQSQAGHGHYYSFPDSELLQQFTQQGLQLVNPGFMLDFAKQFVAQS